MSKLEYSESEVMRKHHVSSYNKEYFKFEWGTVDHEGIWAFGGTIKDIPPVLSGVTVQYPQMFNTEGWWSYIGPVPMFDNDFSVNNPKHKGFYKQAESAKHPVNCTINYPIHKV